MEIISNFSFKSARVVQTRSEICKFFVNKNSVFKQDLISEKKKLLTFLSSTNPFPPGLKYR